MASPLISAVFKTRATEEVLPWETVAEEALPWEMVAREMTDTIGEAGLMPVTGNGRNIALGSKGCVAAGFRTTRENQMYCSMDREHSVLQSKYYVVCLYVFNSSFNFYFTLLTMLSLSFGRKFCDDAKACHPLI